MIAAIVGGATSLSEITAYSLEERHLRLFVGFDEEPKVPLTNPTHDEGSAMSIWVSLL